MNASSADLANVIYLLLALVIWGGVAFSARRRAKDVGARGPGMMLSLLIWAGLIALVVVIIRSAEIWGALLALFR